MPLLGPQDRMTRDDLLVAYYGKEEIAPLSINARTKRAANLARFLKIRQYPDVQGLQYSRSEFEKAIKALEPLPAA